MLVNLGTPADPSPRSVRKYLAEFLSDPRVIEAPRLLWWLVLHGVILRTRPQAQCPRLPEDLDAGGLAAPGRIAQADRRPRRPVAATLRRRRHGRSRDDVRPAVDSVGARTIPRTERAATAGAAALPAVLLDDDRQHLRVRHARAVAVALDAGAAFRQPVLGARVVPARRGGQRRASTGKRTVASTCCSPSTPSRSAISLPAIPTTASASARPAASRSGSAWPRTNGRWDSSRGSAAKNG